MNIALRTVLSYPLAPYDPDTRAYITAVERADGQALETGVRRALDTFVRGCKADGIWNAIKASCVMMGARTLAGALTPLKGAAPTNYNFVSGDYDRKTGLKGDGATKYLDSNRNNNADPQDSTHLGVLVTDDTGSATTHTLAGVDGTDAASKLLQRTSTSALNTKCHEVFGSFAVIAGGGIGTGLKAVTRALPASYTARTNGVDTTVNNASTTPSATSIGVFARLTGPTQWCSYRLSYYSIGEHLDLALLDARVTALSAAIAAVLDTSTYLTTQDGSNLTTLGGDSIVTL